MGYHKTSLTPSEDVARRAALARAYKPALERHWQATTSPLTRDACISLIAVCNMLAGLHVENKTRFPAESIADLNLLFAAAWRAQEDSTITVVREQVFALCDGLDKEERYARAG